MTARILTLAATALLAVVPAASADGPQRFMDRYTTQLAEDFRPSGVKWETVWTHRWAERQFGYGLIGKRSGEWLYCTNFATVRPHHGKPFGWNRIDRWENTAGRRYEIDPDYGWTCLTDEQVTRVGNDSQPLEPGEAP